jgi:hypothetical protein
VQTRRQAEENNILPGGRGFEVNGRRYLEMALPDSERWVVSQEVFQRLAYLTMVEDKMLEVIRVMSIFSGDRVNLSRKKGRELPGVFF